MSEEICEVFLEKESYRPGEIIHGRVECTFTSENKIAGIRVKFRGRAKVYWKEGRSTAFAAEETYFDTDSDLLLSETTFSPGVYNYPFSFNLPSILPSSMEAGHGNIRFSVLATITRPWSFDYESRKAFTVNSYNDLNMMDDLKRSAIFTEEKQPFSFFDDPGLITINVRLPIQGYVPSQMVSFTAEISNNSKITVKELRFKLVQGFTFHVEGKTLSTTSLDGDELTVAESTVSPGSEKSFSMDLRIPEDMFNGNLNDCKIITIFWRLRGEVVVPFPYRNFLIDVPLTLGATPLSGITL